MKRWLLPLLIVAGLLAVAPLAQASDASLKHALSAYKTRLTNDISYLAGFKAPSKSAAGGVLRKLSKVHHDLNGAMVAANGQQASTRSGRKGRTLVLSGLHHALLATSDAQASASAARAGKRGTAKTDAKNEQTEINKAIPQFEQGGRLLHLF
jgi:hypothetical protein